MIWNQDRPPCLYLLWPRLRRDLPEVRLPDGYHLHTYAIHTRVLAYESVKLLDKKRRGNASKSRNHRRVP